MILSFTLPWPPSVNHYWRTPRKGPLAGRTMLSKEGRKYQELVANALLEQSVPRRRLNGSLTLHLAAYPPDERKRDLSNLVKALEDALVKTDVIEDDSLVDDLRVSRHKTALSGFVVVTVCQNS